MLCWWRCCGTYHVGWDWSRGARKNQEWNDGYNRSLRHGLNLLWVVDMSMLCFLYYANRDTSCFQSLALVSQISQFQASVFGRTERTFSPPCRVWIRTFEWKIYWTGPRGTFPSFRVIIIYKEGLIEAAEKGGIRVFCAIDWIIRPSMSMSLLERVVEENRTRKAHWLSMDLWPDNHTTTRTVSPFAFLARRDVLLLFFLPVFSHSCS